MNESDNSRLSGDGGGEPTIGSGSAGEGTNTNSALSSTFHDERSRLERKIEKLREEITRNSIVREGDIEEYLKITASMKNRPENPQMARIRQHFEKKNRKYTQETEHLQKKLETLERRLSNMENGIESPLCKNGTHSVLQNVGYEIRKNLREMTGNVMSAPFDIAQKVKKNVFGSADNIPDQEGSSVGLSTFYDSENQHLTEILSDCGVKCQSTSGELDHKDFSNRRCTDSQVELNRSAELDETHSNSSFVERLRTFKQQNILLAKNFENFKREAENEIRNLQTEMINNRFKIQHLEQTLNETMELHQNEVRQLKNDLNCIGVRMDYQYNDRFNKIEESVEAAHNRMIRMETSWLENSERLLATGQNMWNASMLSIANIVVELLKIALYIIAVVLDSIKPLTGTRKRAGIVLSVLISAFFLWNILFSFFCESFTDSSYSKIKVNHEILTTTESIASDTIK